MGVNLIGSLTESENPRMIYAVAAIECKLEIKCVIVRGLCNVYVAST